MMVQFLINFSVEINRICRPYLFFQSFCLGNGLMSLKIFKPFDSNLNYANLHIAIALGERVVAVVLLPHFSGCV